MKSHVIAAVLLAGFFSCGVGVLAEAAPSPKPLFAGMKNENDSDIQHIRDALTAFKGVNKRWPASIDELSAFAQQYRLALDLTVFDRASYSVQNEAGASVAVFEFIMKGSPTKGAFAIADYVVK